MHLGPVGDGTRSRKARGGAAASALPPLAARDAAAPRGVYQGRIQALISELEDIQRRLLDGGCTDAEGRILAVAQRNVCARMELYEAIDVAERGDRLDASVTDLERQLGGQSGGVLSTDEAPPFNPSGGATH